MSEQPNCYLDLSIGDRPIGRLVVKLYYDRVPKTCENFKHLCIGDMRSPKGVKLTYKNAVFHRVVRDFMMQGGDFTAGDGSGGLSIYGNKFEDERMDLPHDRAGLLSMANKGPNSNSSQFFITFKPCRALDGHHVVFGEVLEGLDLCTKVSRVRTDDNNKPFERVKIDECGVVPPPTPKPPKEHKHHHHHHHHKHHHSHTRRDRSRSRS